MESVKEISDIPLKKSKWFSGLLKKEPLIGTIFLLIAALGWVTYHWNADKVYYQQVIDHKDLQINEANKRADSSYKYANETVQKMLEKQEQVNDQLMQSRRKLDKIIKN